ncbi:MAG: hypothetical protein JRI36_11920 [Deltaproteobacteria bacterium]|nr:hypothetical protein [Deltaproteobacteria bacterium]
MRNVSQGHTCSARSSPTAGLRSKALQVNLEETDRAVTVDPKYLPLQDVVQTLPGLFQQTQALLCELNHPFKNWAYVIREIRNYALRNFPIYYDHPEGPEVVRVIVQEWLDALSLSPDRAVHAAALDNLINFVEKILAEGKSRLSDCMPIFSDLFDRLSALPAEPFFLLASGYYQVKRIGKLACELDEKDFDFKRFCVLLRKDLEVTYAYWLSQEDPSNWFAPVLRTGHRSQPLEALLGRISHHHLRQCVKRLKGIDPALPPKSALEEMLKLPDYGDVVRVYKELVHRVEGFQAADFA